MRLAPRETPVLAHAGSMPGDGGPLRPGAELIAHQRFEAVAREDPGRDAIVAGEETLSYGELDARAGAVARRLQALGLGREDVVGVCLPRRVDALVAIYGVLKAGAAYLPLDPAYPRERVDFMVADARARWVIEPPTPTLPRGAGEGASTPDNSP